MITTESKTANKDLWIYQPDKSLREICAINGPKIVRRMIPCFKNLPYKTYNEGDSGNSFDEPKFSFIYGINVRTPRVNSILPFSTTYRYAYDNIKKKKEGQLLDDFKVKGEIKYKVPEFTEEYKIRELFLYATVKGKKINPDDIVIMSLSSEDKEMKDAKKIKALKTSISQKDGFFAMQVNALGIKERAYLWLTSEDYNVNTGGDALSNFIAISDDYDAIAKHIIPHRLDFVNLLFLIKARHLFDTEMAQRKTAIASAKAAIMSRNMSHNLGSHVMAYLKQHLNSVQDMVHDNVLSSLVTSEDLMTLEGIENWYNKIKDKQKGLDEVALPFLVGLGKFVSYLQERQDFIATIATDYIPYFSTVNFKDFIYDELNPDLRYERHKDRIGLQPDNILLGNIARSEGLARKTNPTKNKEMSDIVLKFRKFDGEPVVDREGTPLKNVLNVNKKEDLEEMRRLMVHLPGGVVGRQAIFSIIENVIRNAAKHGKWGNGSGKKLELTFDYYTIEDINNRKIRKDYCPKGDDSLSVFLRKYYSGASDINDLYVITLTDNMAIEKEGTLIEKCENLNAIRKALIEPYIDKDTVEMLQTNKGIKEMRISAAWMRGIDDDVKINPLYITQDFDKRKKGKKDFDPEDHWIRLSPNSINENITEHKADEHSGYENNAQINDHNDEDHNTFIYKYWNEKRTKWVGKAPILMARACSQNPNEDYHLQYLFCLPRPKDVALVFSSDTWRKWGDVQSGKAREIIKNILSKSSWSIFSIDEYMADHNKSFEFIILEDKIREEDANRIKMVSPNRIFCEKDVAHIINFNKEIIGGNKTSLSHDALYKIKTSLFKFLCDFKPATDIIIISDSKTKNRELSKIPSNVKVLDGCSKAKYLYRTHNETEINFTEYLEATKDDSNIVFVEGITGNNSTDRLVRNDEINAQWLYKHLHAMKTTVGVFDERIFSKIYKRDESDIVLPSFEEFQDECYNYFINDMNLQEKILSASSMDELLEIIGPNYWRRNGDYLAIAYAKKGIGVHNIIKTENGLDIYGYGGETRTTSGINGEDIKYYATIEKIGEIRMIKGKIIIKRSRKAKKFDYLTIHQGLLDKIYEQFEIRHDAYAKHQFTKAFYNAFSTDKSSILYKDPQIKDNKGLKNVYFLPRLRIHSGRSKPSFADMPQHQPFMQYAAIEHAILDCKYSLVELLDFARYEE